MTVLLVALGAAVGAPSRYLLDRAVQTRHDSVFPWGTLSVNVVGCFVLGMVTAMPVPSALAALLGTGFCGALTTYSTFSYETLRLLERRAWLLAGLNAGISLVAGLGAAYVGIALGQAL
ncbi:CrcB protein [Amycolatopsis bartoniae]|uniref:Fluoride-specific ion channel FluC n=1 Tax=Amycolatopsis bartoniae TaxID=941986 RepID=A0A8H9M7F6_9PSEU|nr:fluoride efflux transporter CrcB [Amycolatopsis bartoniae]MBB2938196.1 CrcB protein [Amycolatopsis bartoniae]TVT03204.1 fluoride efflux transporter CrcB [Amycolatopsis bartoniae]GHF33359.1 putative fluoride ion transporter CrcB 2 [Amycolatopsis bartoniae]